MNEEEITFQTLTSHSELDIGYSDDDLVIIDNVKTLAEPGTARVGMNLMAICMQGRAQYSVGTDTVTLARHQLFMAPPNMTLSNFMISPDFEFKAMFFTNRILQTFLRERIDVWNETIYIRRLRVMPINAEGFRFFSNFYDMLQLITATDFDVSYRTDIIQALLRSAFLSLCAMLRRQLPGADAPAAGPAAATAATAVGGKQLFQRFLELLNARQVKHRPVEDYASQLCVTPKYLSAVCKRYSGRTANEWITDHVLEDIRYYLQQTPLTVKQVCDRVGFPNTSFFGKYVKAHFGLTPIQLRKA